MTFVVTPLYDEMTLVLFCYLAPVSVAFGFDKVEEDFLSGFRFIDGQKGLGLSQRIFWALEMLRHCLKNKES